MQAVNNDTQVACRWCHAEKWEHYRSMGSRMVQYIQNVKELSETVAEAAVHVEISQRQNR